MREDDGCKLLSDPEAIAYLRKRLEDGRDWPTVLLEAMAIWTAPFETYNGRIYRYFIGGEAFEWLLLAERLCDAVDDFIPEDEKEELLFTGHFPAYFDPAKLKGILGVDKYRGYLNYYYGVAVEQALLLASELEAQKYHLSSGNRYQEDVSEEAFVSIYLSPKSELLSQFRGYIRNL